MAVCHEDVSICQTAEGRIIVHSRCTLYAVPELHMPGIPRKCYIVLCSLFVDECEAKKP